MAYPPNNFQRPAGSLCDGCRSVNDDVERTVTDWNVGCDRCLGAGSEHVKPPTATNVINASRHPSSLRKPPQELCGDRHGPTSANGPRARRSLRRVLWSSLCSAGVLLLVVPAHAYRPFDGTDADVVEPKSFEIEAGPAHYFRHAEQSYLIAPSLILSLGIIERLELVVDANQYVALGKLSPGVSRVGFLGDDILLKYVLREGSIQDKAGASVAVEGGVLTPEVNGTADFGGSLALIASDRRAWGSVHWNEWFEYNRDHHADLFSGLIVEGPRDWRVRPVAETFYDQDFVTDRTVSALVGAIWTARDSLSFDAAVRAARKGDENEAEVRLGLTWVVGFGHHDEDAAPPRTAKRYR